MPSPRTLATTSHAAVRPRASWTDERYAEERPLPGGHRGIFARQPITAGTLIGAFGGEIRLYKIVDGRIADPAAAAEVIQLYRDGDTIVGLVTPPGARFYGIDHVRHSCEPNLAVVIQTVLVAARDIAAGEELTAEYRTWDLLGYGETCSCPVPEDARCRI